MCSCSMRVHDVQAHAKRQMRLPVLEVAEMGWEDLSYTGVPDQASCPEEGAVALESAAAAIEATLAWRQHRRFLAPQQLTCWDHLVRTLDLTVPALRIPMPAQTQAVAMSYWSTRVSAEGLPLPISTPAAVLCGCTALLRRMHAWVELMMKGGSRRC